MEFLVRGATPDGRVYEEVHSAADPAMDGNVLLTAPTVQLITPDQAKQREDLEVRLAERTRVFRRGLHCPQCGREFRDPTPPMFAFNSPLGACPACQGYGRVLGEASPDRSRTLAEPPVAPWNTPAYEWAYGDLFRACRRYSVRTDVPISRLSTHERAVLLEGRGPAL